MSANPTTPVSPLAASQEAEIRDASRRRLIPYIILLVILFIVAVAATLYQHNAVDKTKSVQVNITGSNFSPATVQIKAGSVVTWTNADQQEHQVAADPFPKDNSIPGFDSKVILAPNDTLAFTFDTKGTYTYHDEKNPLNIKGTIIVN